MLYLMYTYQKVFRMIVALITSSVPLMKSFSLSKLKKDNFQPFHIQRPFSKKLMWKAANIVPYQNQKISIVYQDTGQYHYSLY